MRDGTRAGIVSTLVLAGLFLLGADGGCCLFRVPCTPSIEPGILVAVVNAKTDEAVVDAVLTLVEGAYTEVLQPPGSSLGFYRGAEERPGTYVLTVEAAGFVGQTIDGIVIDMVPCDCHVQTVNLRVDLTPAASAG